MLTTLIRMKLTIMKNTPGGVINWKTVIGLGLALVTILLGTIKTDSAHITTGLLAMAFASWTTGWVLAPIQTGAGADEPLMPEHFALLPIAPRRIAVGLLAANLIGIGPLVTLIAFSSLVVYGVRQGVVATIVSIVAMILQVALAVFLSRVVTSAASSAMKSWIGLEFAALQYAIVISLSTVGWVIPAALANNGHLLDDPRDFVTRDLPSGLAFIVRVLPSGWGTMAVEEAGNGEWIRCLAALSGLTVITGLLVLIWGIQLDRRMTSRATRIGAKARLTRFRIPEFRPATAFGGTVERELRTWIREPRSALELRIAILGGFLIALIPATVNWTGSVPCVGIAIAILAAATSCNLYGLEGSALWTTIVTPGAPSSDVRGKQTAFLIVFGPIAALLTIICTVWGEQTWAWPWVTALLPATLGAGAGVMIVISIRGCVPVPESARKSGNLVAAADNTGQTVIAMILVGAALLPTIAILAVGTWIGNLTLEWAALPIGIGTGILFAWLGGKIAINDLETHGAELLTLIRYGRRT